MNAMERTALIFAFVVLVSIIKLLSRKKDGQKRAERIGKVECQRCRHIAPAKSNVEVKLGQDFNSTLTCARCGSHDWRAV